MKITTLQHKTRLIINYPQSTWFCTVLGLTSFYFNYTKTALCFAVAAIGFIYLNTYNHHIERKEEEQKQKQKVE